MTQQRGPRARGLAIVAATSITFAAVTGTAARQAAPPDRPQLAENVFGWLDGRDTFDLKDVRLNVPIDAGVFVGRNRK